MNKKKSFAPHHHEPAELQFFASLPLEDAAECIRQLAGTYAVAIAPLDEDAYSFEIYQRNIAPNPVFVKGVMRRWEGTYTKLDCETGFQQEAPKLKIQPNDWYWLRGLFLIMGMLIIFLVWLQSMSGIQVFVVEALPFLLVGVLATFVIFYHAQHTMPASRFSQFMEQRIALLDALKAVLETPGVVAYSPEELTENMAIALEAENRLSESGTS